MCYDGPYPDGRELSIVNLADKTAAKNHIKLKNLKFICFVGHESNDYTSSICFLAKDFSKTQFKVTEEICEQRIVLCVLSCS